MLQEHGNAGAESDHPNNAEPRSSRAGDKLLAQGALVLAVSAALVALVLHASFRLGRLAGIPVWDDVGTFWQAASWVKVFYQHGVPGVARAYLAAPPHSPYSALLALTAYLLFGIVEWAPYALTFFQVCAFLAFVNWMLRAHGAATRCFAMIFAAALPFVSAGINEFKGDYASALALAIAAVLITTAPFWSASPRRHYLVGLLLALALWTKPSLFAPICLLAIGALGVSYISEWIIDRRMAPIPRAARALARIAFVVAFIAGPHFWVAGRFLWNYMVRNNFGKDTNKWVVPGTFWFQVRYYLTGGGGRMLGNFAFALGALVVLAGVVMLVRHRRTDAVRFGALLSVVVASYVMPSLNPVKSVLLGLDFHTLLGLAGVFSLGYLLTEVDSIAPRRTLSPALAGVLALTGLCLYRPTFAWHPYSQTAAERRPLEERRALSRTLFDEVAGHARNGPVRLTLLSGVGEISFDLFTLYAAQEGIDLDTRAVVGRTMDDYLPLVDNADIVIAAEPGTGMTLNMFEEQSIHKEALEMMDARPDFTRVLRVPAPRSDSLFVVFERREMVMDGFAGVRALSGMLPLEGPFPQWHTPRVRWGVAPGTVLETLVPEGSYMLRMMCQTHAEGQVMTVRLDGKEIGALHFVQTRDWEPLDLPVTLEPGPHKVTLEYTASNASPDAARAVLFRGLSFGPASGSR